jgi:hypothetical protein
MSPEQKQTLVEVYAEDHGYTVRNHKPLVSGLGFGVWGLGFRVYADDRGCTMCMNKP